MKKICLLFLMIVCGTIVLGQKISDKKMPATTKSDAALKHLIDAVKAYEDVNFTVANDLLLKAKQEDPDFFMADFYLAWANFGNKENFKKYATDGINCKNNLSDAEELLRDALKRLLENNAADATDIGNKLVAMYPEDEMAYMILFFFQNIVKDQEGSLETLLKATEATAYPGPFYNQLGYYYMNRNINDKALAAFDKYIELCPDNPNVYDSKGDYFFHMKEYRKAYECFIKANNMGFEVSAKKAQQSQQIADSLGI